jgi:Catalase
LINAENKAVFVKFHWTPKQGLTQLVWDEAQKLAGKDPDFHRRDLYEAIASGNYPEWELGVQIVPEEDEMKFDFDLLDATKIIPEELVPVTPIGRMVLNRNVDYFFGETEQVAFCPGHVVPGIDFTNDPLLQARLFSYTDTQLSRLVVQTSIRFQSISRFVHSITTSVMVCINVLFTPDRPTTNQTRLMTTGRLKRQVRLRQVVSKAIRNVLTVIKSASVVSLLMITSLMPVYSIKARHRMSRSILLMPMSSN